MVSPLASLVRAFLFLARCLLKVLRSFPRTSLPRLLMEQPLLVEALLLVWMEVIVLVAVMKKLQIVAALAEALTAKACDVGVVVVPLVVAAVVEEGALLLPERLPFECPS